MSDKRAEPSRPQEQPRSQISGRRKDDFIRRVLQEVPDLDEETAAEVARHLGAAISTVKTDRTLIERYQKPAFDPNAFSLMKVYRTSGERGLRERLCGIEESRHLQALAKAQQISLPRGLRSGTADASVLKEAIVKGVVSRHEDWLAAS